MKRLYRRSSNTGIGNLIEFIKEHFETFEDKVRVKINKIQVETILNEMIDVVSQEVIEEISEVREEVSGVEKEINKMNSAIEKKWVMVTSGLDPFDIIT